MPFFHTPSFDSIEPILPNTPVEIEPILPNTPVEIEPSQRRQRTAAAPINIAKDIRIIYRYFFIIGFLFIMIIFGLSAIIYSSLKVNQCQSTTPSDLTMIIIFGLVDISICSLALIFVILNVTYFHCVNDKIPAYIFSLLIMVSLYYCVGSSRISSRRWIFLPWEFLLKSSDQNEYCDLVIHMLVILIKLCMLLIFCSYILYVCFMFFKKQCKTRQNNRDVSMRLT